MVCAQSVADANDKTAAKQCLSVTGIDLKVGRLHVVVAKERLVESTAVFSEQANLCSD